MKEINVNYFPLVLGVYIGTGVLMFIDAAVSVSLIDMKDPSTMPNMHPWIRLYFIPVVGTFFAVIASIAELLRNFIWKTNINKFPLWILLGASYTTIQCGLVLGSVTTIPLSYILISLCVLAFNPIIVHYNFGRSKIEKI